MENSLNIIMSLVSLLGIAVIVYLIYEIKKSCKDIGEKIQADEGKVINLSSDRYCNINKRNVDKLYDVFFQDFEIDDIRTVQIDHFVGNVKKDRLYAILEISKDLKTNIHDNQYKIKENSISLGRSEENNVVIYDKTVSREHCIITVNDGEYWIEDLNSSNGTYVDGKAIINRQKLNKTCTIVLGGFFLKFKKIENDKESKILME